MNVMNGVTLPNPPRWAPRGHGGRRATNPKICTYTLMQVLDEFGIDTSAALGAVLTRKVARRKP